MILVFLLLITLIYGFNVGFSPNYYQFGDKVDLLTNKIESDKTQLPYSYHKLPFVCPPMDGAKPVHLSLGEIVKGDRIWQSGYELKFGVDTPCNRLCDLRASERGISRADQLIKDGYVIHWLIDGLPGATTFESSNQRNKYYAAGFPLGFVNQGISYIYNHVMLVIRYHREKQGNVIVGFEVYPKSVINEECPGSSKDFQNFALKYRNDKQGNLIKEKTLIPYTYSVYWREDKSIDYESRWDLYYENDSGHVHIHWISFINSLILIALGSLIVSIVLIKVLKKDIKSPATLPINKEEPSWKNLINEGNSSPPGVLYLTILVSGGIQVLITAIGIVTLLTLPYHQSAFALSIICFILSGLISSYIGMVLHKVFNNDNLNQPYDNFKSIILSLCFTAAIPVAIFLFILILNFFVWFKEASTALPFGTIIVFILIFILIQCPFGIIAGTYGNKKKFDVKSQPSEKSKSILSFRQTISTYFKRVVVYGLIPFGIVYVELLFIFNSVWLEKTTFYYMYGFLFITTIMLIIIIMQSSIISIYISLVIYNDPNWYWLSFQVGSSIGWYIYIYSIYYFFKYLNVDDFVSILLYFSYMGIASFLIGVAGGAIGVLTGLIFIRRIYRAIKLE
ncbi:unnamed protein product [Candida verbasci]|uniref:Transmembrane 9 superfamily member n=1 Tax=Candida verbasci TaxID=1227364 RepID=A0A9W4TQA2_9ASCO|nr:unnamed protein product [Candida verbasci]